MDKKMLITAELLNSTKNSHGHFTKKQRVLINNRYRMPIISLLGKDIPEDVWGIFESLATKKDTEKNQSRKQKAAVKKVLHETKPKSKIINTVSGNDGKDWAWKPDKTDIPKIKVKPSKNNKNRGRNKKTINKVSRYDNKEFYSSKEWRALRVRVLEKYACKCMMCGRNPKDHGVVIHVDHIKPRSKFPELSLTFENLQLLCADCNLGKSNKYQTDWRPKEDFSEELDLIALENSPL